MEAAPSCHHRLILLPQRVRFSVARREPVLLTREPTSGWNARSGRPGKTEASASTMRELNQAQNGNSCASHDPCRVYVPFCPVQSSWNTL